MVGRKDLSGEECTYFESHSDVCVSICCCSNSSNSISAPTTKPTLSTPMAPSTKTIARNVQQERQEWEQHKKQRIDEHTRKKIKTENTDDTKPNTAQRPKMEPGQGYYSYEHEHHHVENDTSNNSSSISNNTTPNPTIYLEGVTFGDILEEDMPIQLWCGPLLATDAEKRLPDRTHHWITALVVAVRPRKEYTDWADRTVVDVAFCETPDALEETLVRQVPLNRIRLILGGDECIPDNLEEARLLAMGGEEITHQEQSLAVDDATGLSGWSTVAVKRTTVRLELKEERERLRRQRREAILEEERQKKEVEARKMEEAKVANADDSALGAYDVWNRTKEGYKGVDIHSEVQVDAHELGKKLSEGKASVGFKKAVLTKKKKVNRRTTSADDD